MSDGSGMDAPVMTPGAAGGAERGTFNAMMAGFTMKRKCSRFRSDLYIALGCRKSNGSGNGGQNARQLCTYVDVGVESIPCSFPRKQRSRAAKRLVLKRPRDVTSPVDKVTVSWRTAPSLTAD